MTKDIGLTQRLLTPALHSDKLQVQKIQRRRGLSSHFQLDCEEQLKHCKGYPLDSYFQTSASRQSSKRAYLYNALLNILGHSSFPDHLLNL